MTNQGNISKLETKVITIYLQVWSRIKRTCPSHVSIFVMPENRIIFRTFLCYCYFSLTIVSFSYFTRVSMTCSYRLIPQYRSFFIYEKISVVKRIKKLVHRCDNDLETQREMKLNICLKLSIIHVV